MAGLDTSGIWKCINDAANKRTNAAGQIAISDGDDTVATGYIDAVLDCVIVRRMLGLKTGALEINSKEEDYAFEFQQRRFNFDPLRASYSFYGHKSWDNLRPHCPLRAVGARLRSEFLMSLGFCREINSGMPLLA